MSLSQRTRWSGVVAHLLTIAVGVVGGAVLFGPASKGSWPAWVQAIGSVAAIVTAVLVPNRIAAKERKAQEMKRKFRAKSYAFVLLPMVESLRGSLKAARVRWAQMPGKYEDDDVTEYLGIPPGITDRMLDLHEIGESGLAIQNVVIAIIELRQSVTYEYMHMRYAGTYFDPETGEEAAMPDPDDVAALFKAAEEKAEAAISALTNVLNC